VITKHAHARMRSRSITEADISDAIEFGRTFFSRGAIFKIVGRKEIRRFEEDVDLRHLDGLHVVLAADGAVITVYKNKQFRRGDFRKPRYRGTKQWSAGLWGG
jgi:hypothetical protein